jgi:flagellar export protein FliJ
MKPFKFTLQAVRTVREREEHHALHEYVGALRALEEVKGLVETVEQEIGATWAALRQAIQSGSASAGEITRLQAFCQALVQRRTDLETALKAARAKANRAFAVYLAAHQACAMVEQCCVRQKRRHQADRRRHEQKTLDDIAQRSLSLACLVMRTRGTIWN